MTLTLSVTTGQLKQAVASKNPTKVSELSDPPELAKATAEFKADVKKQESYTHTRSLEERATSIDLTTLIPFFEG